MPDGEKNLLMETENRKVEKWLPEIGMSAGIAVLVEGYKLCYKINKV